MKYPTHILRRSLLTMVTLLFCMVCLLPTNLNALVLDEENRLTITLKDGTSVSLIGEAARRGQKSKNYYYLPVNLRLSQRRDQVPEFLFLKYTTDARADQGGIGGGLLHFLMEWGLTPAQEREVKQILERDFKKSTLKGAVPMEPEGDQGSFRIISATLSDAASQGGSGQLTRSLVTSGVAPLVPGGKVAAASNLTADGAQLLAATLEKTRSITDVSIELNFAYPTLTPAAKGYILFDWSKLERESETLRMDYSRRQTGTRKTKDCFLVFCASSSRPTYSYSYEEVAEQFKFLEEKEVVKFHFEETVADERVAKIREAFTQYFLQMMAEPDPEAPPPPPADPQDASKAKPNVRQGDGYRYRQSSFTEEFKRKSRRIDLNYALTIKRPFSITANLGSWYDGVRDNPKCVAFIRLDDPFFKHFDIHFILSQDAARMFEDFANYVTVNVRKTRSEGHPFEDRVTIDAAYLREHGVRATLTYARGEDKTPMEYEYQTQWSFADGTVYPANPVWTSGLLEGVTLSPPVRRRVIEMEADLGELEDSDFTRVTAQVRYWLLGEEREENIQLSVAKQESVTEKPLYMDRVAKGYAYRLILNHKRDGKLVLPWQTNNDDYLYAIIPDEYLEEGSSLRSEAIEAGKTAVEDASDKILSRFANLLE